MSDTEMTLAEAIKFLNTPRASRGRPPKSYSEQKDLAVKIVNAAEANGKLAKLVGTNPAAVKSTTKTTKSAEPLTETILTLTPEELAAQEVAKAEKNAVIDDALASLPDAPPGAQW